MLFLPMIIWGVLVVVSMLGVINARKKWFWLRMLSTISTLLGTLLTGSFAMTFAKYLPKAQFASISIIIASVVLIVLLTLLIWNKTTPDIVAICVIILALLAVANTVYYRKQLEAEWNQEIVIYDL